MTFFKNLRNAIKKKRRSLSHLSLLSANTIVSSVASFIIVLILANSLSQNDYGNYKYIYSVAGMLSALSLSSGFRNMVIQSAARNCDGILRTLPRKNLVLNLPMVAAAFAAGIYYYLEDNPVLGLGVCIVGIATVVGNNGIIASAYLNGRKEYTKLFLVQLVTSVGSVLSITVPIFLFPNLIGIIVTVAVVSSSIALLSLWYVQRYLSRNHATDIKINQYGRHLSFLGIMSTFLQYIDSVLIFKFLGSQSLAIYAIATPIVDRIIGFFKGVYFFALPKFTELGPKDARRSLYKRSFAAFFMGAGIFAIYVFISPLFFRIFFPDYMESVQLSWLFALNIPIVAFAILPMAYLDSLVEIQNKYVLNGSSFIFRIATIFLLIWPFGIVGVIISELLTRVFGAIIVCTLIEQHMRRLPKS